MTPTLSVVIPAYRAGRTLPEVLGALRPQVGPDVEVIVVESSGDGAAARLADDHPWVTVIDSPRRLWPGQARNLGARTARSSWLAFLDADTVPRPEWLVALRERATGDSRAVAGSVVNGTPRSVMGTVSYLLEFSELMPESRGRLGHAGSGNLLIARAALLDAGGFAEDLRAGEDTVLTVPFARRGELEFEPAAQVAHLNRTGFAAVLVHQFRLGRSFAAVCDRAPVPYARFSRWPLLLAAPGLRLLTLLLRLARRRPGLALRAVLWGPLLALGLAAWDAGLMVERCGRRSDADRSAAAGHRRGRRARNRRAASG